MNACNQGAQARLLRTTMVSFSSAAFANTAPVVRSSSLAIRASDMVPAIDLSFATSCSVQFSFQRGILSRITFPATGTESALTHAQWSKSLSAAPAPVNSLAAMGFPISLQRMAQTALAADGETSQHRTCSATTDVSTSSRFCVSEGEWRLRRESNPQPRRRGRSLAPAEALEAIVQ